MLVCFTENERHVVIRTVGESYYYCMCKRCPIHIRIHVYYMVKDVLSGKVRE
jgi:hypothetical protein